MKGRKLSISDLKEFDKKEVWLHFSFRDLSFDGADEDYSDFLAELASEYPDGLFLVNWEKQYLQRVGDEHPFHFHHNLINSIYEWIPE